MKLPDTSTWHIIKGTWFVYKKDNFTVHIQLKNNGEQLVFVNGELSSRIKSFKLNTEQNFEWNKSFYSIRTSPVNKAMTSFSTDLVKNDQLLITYTFTYRTDLKRFLPLLIAIIVLTVPLVLLKLPEWTFYAMVGIVIMFKIFLFNKNLFEITERENKFAFDV